MKKIIALFLIITCSIAAHAQFDPIGTWMGKLNINKDSINVYFNIGKTESNIYKATMDIPDQGAKGLSCSNVVLKKDSLIIEIKMIAAVYSGKFTSINTIEGILVQRGFSLPLKLKHTTEVAELNRPQTPKPPFNYNIDSVEYDNADKTVHLGATLTYPKAKGTFPVAVMITGSGLQDRDETLFGHKPFAVIADYLTNHGIAVLRVDDRTIGKSTGDVKHATSVDFANDVLTSINYLLTRKEIDKNKIGVIGHSEGGFIAPIVYTKFPKLAFIISLAGTGVSAAEILLRQQTDPAKKIFSEQAFNAFYNLTKQTLYLIHNNYSSPDSIILNKVKVIFNNWKSNLNDSIQSQLKLTNITPDIYANFQVKPELDPWHKYFIATEPDIFWSKVKCPVLALNGEKDVQVYPEQNINAITTSLKKAGNKNVTTKILPGLNHLFQHCTKCTFDEYAKLEETFSPEVLELMNDWLQKNVVNK